jgi:site-specific recombinase XerD
MSFTDCLLQFFDQYLIGIKGARNHTVRAYRDTFGLFLPFAAQRSGCKIKELQVEQLTVQLILDFLDHLEKERHNKVVTRNLRLAAFKSLAKMLRIVQPEYRLVAERLLTIPQKRAQKPLVGYLSHEEILKVFATVDLRKKEGFRDYTILHLLFDSGASASEIAALNLNSFDGDRNTLAILGKGNRYRLIELWPKTAQLLDRYIANYRPKPKPAYSCRLFINQRGMELTRHGIYRLGKKYLARALPAQRIANLQPAHGFRHYGERYKMVREDSKPARPADYSLILSPFYH